MAIFHSYFDITRWYFDSKNPPFLTPEPGTDSGPIPDDPKLDKTTKSSWTKPPHNMLLFLYTNGIYWYTLMVYTTNGIEICH